MKKTMLKVVPSICLPTNFERNSFSFLFFYKKMCYKRIISSKYCSFEFSIHQRILKNMTVSTNILSSTTMFNIDNIFFIQNLTQHSFFSWHPLAGVAVL